MSPWFSYQPTPEEEDTGKNEPGSSAPAKSTAEKPRKEEAVSPKAKQEFSTVTAATQDLILHDREGQAGKRFGGFVKQSVDPEEHKNPPHIAVHHQLVAECAGYREAAIRDGIAPRKDGLFPPGDPFLTDLIHADGLHPFEKHLGGLEGPYEELSKGSWVSGNSAAQAGFDLRLFYKEKGPGEEFGALIGAARLGDKASIGNGFWMSSHGGAMESLLDEATAELGKMEFAPLLCTIEANFKLKQALPLHTTVRIDAKIARKQGARVWVHGSVTLPGSKDIILSCEAQCVDLRPVILHRFADAEQRRKQ